VLRCANETRWYFVVLTVCWCLIAAIATVSRIASDPKTERTDWLARATRTRQLTWSRRFQGLSRVNRSASAQDTACRNLLSTHGTLPHDLLSSRTSLRPYPECSIKSRNSRETQAFFVASHKCLGSQRLARRGKCTCRSRLRVVP